MIVRADFFEERFVRLIVGAAAQIAILAQPRVDVHDKGYRQVGSSNTRHVRNMMTSANVFSRNSPMRLDRRM